MVVSFYLHYRILVVINKDTQQSQNVPPSDGIINTASTFVEQDEWIRKSSSNYHASTSTIKGVIVIKVADARQASRTLCTLTKFFNSKHQYPIRIFADKNYTEDTYSELLSIARGGTTTTATAERDADLKIIVDLEQRWRKFPPELDEDTVVREKIISQCQNLDGDLHQAICATTKTPLNYIYMGYWRYRLMAYEPSLRLQHYDYFISIDSDTYLTKPLTDDPFQLMARENLTGFYIREIANRGDIGTGIEKILPNVYKNDPSSLLLDNNAPALRWLHHRNNSGKVGSAPAPEWNRKTFSGHFYGGRFDFLRTPQFREYSRQMVPFTYLFRTDEQSVIGAAWAASGRAARVWNWSDRLATKQPAMPLGIYHQGWVEDVQVVDCKARPSPPTTDTVEYFDVIVSSSIAANNDNDNNGNICHWINHKNNRVYVHSRDLLLYEEYTATLGYERGHPWEECICTQTKDNFILRKSCPGWQSMRKKDLEK